MEELRSEKNLLLASLAYTEEDAADKFLKDIAAMEQSLKRLEEQEQKYSAELDAALNEYAGLRAQAQGFNLVQLYEARQAIRPGKEQEAENRAQEVYGEKYNPLLMFDSKKAVSPPVIYTDNYLFQKRWRVPPPPFCLFMNMLFNGLYNFYL